MRKDLWFLKIAFGGFLVVMVIFDAIWPADTTLPGLVLLIAILAVLEGFSDRELSKKGRNTEDR